jgi:Zn-dependent protease
VFRLPQVRLGRVLGIPVEVDPSWFIVFGLVGWSLAREYYPAEFPGRTVSVDVVSGILTALVFFASLLAHEFSHSLVARRAGISVERITLFLFGGVAQLAEEPRASGVELGMALAGPGSSLLMGLGWFALFRLAVGAGLSDVVWAPLVTLATVNVVIAVFNLTPGFPMDGGRVLRALLWWTTGDRRLATRVASLIGQVIAVGIVAAGAWLAYTGSFSGLWLVFVGLFVRVLASRAYTAQLARLRIAATAVADLMVAPVPTLETAAPVSAAEALIVADGGEGAVVVVEDGRVIGLLDRSVLAGVDEGSATAGGAAVAPDVASLVDADESLETVLRRPPPAGQGPLLVIREGRLVGQVSRRRLGEALLRAGRARG